MASFNWPATGGRVATYSTFASFPTAASQGAGALAIALDTDTLYLSDGTSWIAVGGSGVPLAVGNLDAQPANAKGLTLTSNTLYQQSATGSFPGLVNTTTQTFAGVKTFSSPPNFSSLTASQALVLDGSKNVASLAYSSTGGISNLVSRDANGNSVSNNWVSGATNVVSGGTITNLTAASTRLQQLTGTLNQTFRLPDATTLSVGSTWEFNNNSTGTLTVTDFGANTIGSAPSGGYMRVVAIAVVTSNGAWDKHYLMPANASYGTSGMTVTGTITATGTLSGSNFSGSSSGTNTGDVTLTAVGSSPNGNGASLSGQALTLQPADGTNPGLLTALAQTIGGVKTFSSAPNLSSLTASQALVLDASKNVTTLAYGSTNTASTLVERDGSGNFSAGTITAALTGTASGNTTYTANNHGVVVSSATNAMTVVAPDASTSKVLVSGGSSADPSWSLLTNSNLSGSAAISNANLASMSAHTYKGNNTGSPSTPLDVTSTQLTADLNQFTSSLQGLVPGSGGGSTNFLRADGTWAAPAGTSYTFADSIVNTAGTVTLVNDSASPGNSKYYGTNSSGTLGYYAVGAGSGSANNLEILEQKNESEHYGIVSDALDNSIGTGFATLPASYYTRGILLESSSTPAIVWSPSVLNSAAPDTTSTTNWTAVANVTGITTSTTNQVGGHSVQFTKNASGLSTIKYDYGSLAFGIPYNTRLWFWINFASVTNITDVYISVSNDATTYGTNFQSWTSTTNYAGSAIAAGWNLMFFDISTGGSATGTGWNYTLPARFFTVGANGTNTSDIILVNGIYFGLGNSALSISPANYVPLGTVLTIADGTNSEVTFQVDSSNTQVDGPITLTSALSNTYAGGFAGASVYRSTLTLGNNQALLGANDPNGNAYAGAITTAQEIRLSRYLRSALSSSTLEATVSIVTPQNYLCFSTTTNQIVIIDAADTHLNLLSGDVVHCFSTTYDDGGPNYIYLGDFTLTSNSTASGGNTTLTGTGGVPVGVAAGSLIIKKQISAAKYSAVSTATTNESFSNLTADSSPDGIIAYSTNFPVPNPQNVWALWTLSESKGNINQIGPAPNLTVNGTVTTTNIFKNGQYASSGWSGSNFYSIPHGSYAAIDGTVSITVSAWVYYAVGSSALPILSDWAGAGGGFACYVNSSGLATAIFNNNQITANAVNVGAWNHLVFQFNSGGTVTIYQNGVLTKTSTGNTFSAAAAVSLDIGIDTVNTGNAAQEIAQVIVWNGANLSASQVTQLYNNGLAQVIGNAASSMIKYRYKNTGVSGQKLSLYAQLKTDTTAIQPFISQMGIVKTA